VTTRAPRLSPTARRAAALAAQAHHPSLLRGADGDPDPRLPGLAAAPPALVTLELEDFVPRFHARAGDPAAYRQLLLDDVPERESDSAWRLHPPLHRLAHLALVEAGCSAPGEPPVDRRRIKSAGLVVRRLVDGVEQRWLKRDGKVIGWVAHPAAADDDDAAYEPDPKRRAKRATDPAWRLLALSGDLVDDGYEEVSTPCFAAPPAVCAAVGRTLVYGTVPTASVEVSDPDPQPPFTADFLVAAMPAWLRAAPKTPPPALPVTVAPGDDPAAQSADVQQFRRDLAWLVQGAGLGGDDPSAVALRALLAGLSVGFDDDADGAIDRTQPLADLLDAAKPVLLDRNPGAAAVRLPDAWPAIADDQPLRDAVVACFTARWTAMSPGIGRFEDPAARYVVKVFARIAGECGCPERIRWSPPTAPCAILPWYAASPRPPNRIVLPDVGDLDKLKPNVAFAIPPGLRAILDGLDMKGLVDGKQGSAFGEWGMICSFSIPIITLCAFIILYIFLGLLNIVFWWMLWVKICIPFPKKT
jgi:hypothetical protein